MTTAHDMMTGIRPLRRPLWIVLVDALLPVVLVFWTIVDRSSSVVASRTQTGLSSN